MSPRTVAEVSIEPAAPGAIARLREAGYRLVVVTNQPDVARGVMELTTARRITESVVDALSLDDGYLCPHDGPDSCPCRKPKPGMLQQAAHDWNLDLDATWLIGDRWVDIGAARAAGVRSVLLETPSSWMVAGGAAAPPDLVATVVVPTLGAAVDAVLSARSRREEDPGGSD
jgi:D-glycero-D-manno-heptose 1,7-bisphosphate phosphatase